MNTESFGTSEPETEGNESNYNSNNILSNNELSDYRIFQEYDNPITAETQHDNLIKDEEKFQERFPSWSKTNGKPINISSIKDIFTDLTEEFGFQKDNCNNMFDFLMSQLESRSSRMACTDALMSLHSDYIGGDKSNYKKWYFIAHFELDEEVKDNSMWPDYYGSLNNRNKIKSKSSEKRQESFLGMDYKWKLRMLELTYTNYVEQLAIYLLIWGESNNIRFMPECICFIFKCCLDHYYQRTSRGQRIISFLDEVITPIYQFIRNQQFKLVNGKWIKNSKDHDSIIGYDDVNQFFWFSSNLKNIKLTDGSLLLDLEKSDRLERFKTINWKSCFYKSYREKRTWNHLLTNFSRIWIIHLSMFWYYTSFNSPTLYTIDYSYLVDNPPAPQVQLTIVSFGGCLACLISIFATIFEYFFVPRSWPGAQRLFPKLLTLILLSIINVGPSIYILGFIPLDKYSIHGYWISVSQFSFSVMTFLYLAIVPPSSYFRPMLRDNWNHIKSTQFTASFFKLSRRSNFISLSVWAIVFTLKFFESYVFLTLSLRDPIRVLATMDLSRCRGDIFLGVYSCRYQAKILLLLLYITDLVLFFLDTYLWYIIVNCFFSVGLSLNLGISILTPWKNIFIRLPERIFTKLVFESKKSSLDKSFSVAQIWNAIILSLYRDHLISLEQMNKLIYQFFENDELLHIDPPIAVKVPNFFIFQDDNSFNLGEFFSCGKEAERRISFFAQSLACTLPEPIPTKAVPSFTVLVPHYSETILMELKELIKESRYSKVSILDYLKELHPLDWERFVQDTRILNNMSATLPDVQYLDNSSYLPSASASASARLQDKFDDIPYYYIGFKSSDSEYTLRTRIWASLRSQTLYRTVSGFMNYENALRVLYKSEDVNFSIQSDIYQDESEEELKQFVQRKFRLLLCLQNYQNFTPSEIENVHHLVESFPNVQISYLETATDEITNETIYYSTLLDLENKDDMGQFLNKYRIRLSGNPILGDGKSDNQNSSIIFYRGEYLQVVDANQDNYIEECMKIKSVLSEFEEYNMSTEDYCYDPELSTPLKSQVAIVGAREYIFSENVGVLGDLAAAKEQTFGTLFARTLAEIGGKLHYGHPDFLYGIFMTTRGGVSKAQKGLHLNEDVYAGMTAICRGGRIKHSDYYQCGKGRDLGFNTVSNFTVKIGTGMGEQILSRDHYYLGTSLPIDRFLSFYYAHAGFHINNLFISLSASLFMLVLLNLGSLRHETIICKFDVNELLTQEKEPLGCYDLQPVLNWISRFVLSVSVCFFISFLPLLIQEMIEKGPMKAFLRILFHLSSFSPLFEVFICQIYAKSLSESISRGDAKYIATGRGFATSRQHFSYLFTRYSNLSIYYGSNLFIILIFACITIWQVSLLWFFISFVSMCLAPFFFNPHQFSWKQFFLDYKELIRWFSRGNSRWHNNSWYNYQKMMRSKVLGCKKKPKSAISSTSYTHKKDGGVFHRIFDLIVRPFILTFFSLTAYLFINSQTGVRSGFKGVNPIFRIIIVSVVPIILNSVVLFVSFCISCMLGPILQFRKFGTIMAAFNHFMAVLICLLNFNLLLFTESWNWPRTLSGLVSILSIHNCLKGLIYLFLSKEVGEDSPNYSWWSGKWVTSGLGVLILTQPIREYAVKVIEQIQFAYDFILTHCLLLAITPILFVPFIDKLHTMSLFWSKHTKASYHSPILSQRIKWKRNWSISRYAMLYFATMVSLLGMIIVPQFLKGYVPDLDRVKVIPKFVGTLIQPNHQRNNDTGSNIPPGFSVTRAPVVPMETIS